MTFIEIISARPMTAAACSQNASSGNGNGTSGCSPAPPEPAPPTEMCRLCAEQDQRPAVRQCHPVDARVRRRHRKQSQCRSDGPISRRRSSILHFLRPSAYLPAKTIRNTSSFKLAIVRAFTIFVEIRSGSRALSIGGRGS